MLSKVKAQKADSYDSMTEIDTGFAPNCVRSSCLVSTAVSQPPIRLDLPTYPASYIEGIRIPRQTNVTSLIMSSVIVDRPVVTTPSSEWGPDPLEDRPLVQRNPASYFKPSPRSSPYSRPHPPTSEELEVPGAYPRDPRDALDALSATAGDYQPSVNDLLPSQGTLHTAVSSVGIITSDALGSISVAGAEIVSAASGEEGGLMGRTTPPISKEVPLHATALEFTENSTNSPDSKQFDNLSFDGSAPLFIPADLPSAPFLIPMPQFSDMQTAHDDRKARDGSCAEDSSFIPEGIPDLSPSLAPESMQAPSVQAGASDLDSEVERATESSDDLVSDTHASSAPNVSPATSSGMDNSFAGITPLPHSKSVESLGSESGIGNGVAGDIHQPSYPESNAEQHSSAEHAVNSGDRDNNPPGSSVNKLHIAAGAAGIIGTAASLVMKAAKRKNESSNDAISESKGINNNPNSANIPSDLPKSPAIFHDEFAAAPPVPAPVGRPEVSNTPRHLDEPCQGKHYTDTAGAGTAGVTAIPALTHDKPAENEFPPSTHTPAQQPVYVRPQQRSMESSPAALFGVQPDTEMKNNNATPTPEATIGSGGAIESNEEKVSKLDFLAGAVGAAGVAAGLVAKMSKRKAPKDVSASTDEHFLPVENQSLNSPLPSELPKTPSIFTEEFVAVPFNGLPTVAGDKLTVPPSPHAADSPFAHLPDQNLKIANDEPTEEQTDTNFEAARRSALPVPAATYSSGGSKLSEPGAGNVKGDEGSTFNSPDVASTQTVLPHCGAQGPSPHSPTLPPRSSARKQLGGMGTNGFDVPDAHPPFVQLSSLPVPGEIANPAATIEAVLGTKAHGEPAAMLINNSLDKSVPSANAQGRSSSSLETHQVRPMTNRSADVSSSGSSDRSNLDVPDGTNRRLTASKGRRTSKTKDLLEKMKERLRF